MKNVILCRNGVTVSRKPADVEKHLADGWKEVEPKKVKPKKAKAEDK